MCIARFPAWCITFYHPFTPFPVLFFVFDRLIDIDKTRISETSIIVDYSFIYLFIYLAFTDPRCHPSLRSEHHSLGFTRYSFCCIPIDSPMMWDEFKQIKK